MARVAVDAEPQRCPATALDVSDPAHEIYLDTMEVVEVVEVVDRAARFVASTTSICLHGDSSAR